MTKEVRKETENNPQGMDLLKRPNARVVFLFSFLFLVAAVLLSSFYLEVAAAHKRAVRASERERARARARERTPCIPAAARSARAQHIAADTAASPRARP